MMLAPVLKKKCSLHVKDSHEFSTLLADTNNTDLHFTLTYFHLASVGSTARELLEYAGAHHTKNTVTVETWKEGNTPSGFSCLPMLTVRFPDNRELNIAESIVIDTFLAERFGLLGDNLWESNLVRMFYCNIHYLRDGVFTEVFIDPESKRNEHYAHFKNVILKKFLEDHEYHLKENGSNGHYVGKKLSLADIHLWNIVHFFGTAPWGQDVIDMFKLYPYVWKVWETVDKLPQLAKWRASDEFRAYEKKSIEDYSEFAVKGVDNVAPLTNSKIV
ncbi:Glutathione S-transferase S1 [Linnemannia zychae]|nr:Glutathione S-transferase S1 [Linnemannia zychae]